MKPFGFLLVFLFIIFTRQAAGETLEISGYFENQFYLQTLSHKLIFQDYNKLRLSLSAKLTENIHFDGNFVYRTFHGADTFSLFDVIPDQILQKHMAAQNIPPDILRALLTYQLENENYLDNAFATLDYDAVIFRIGKQQLPWGSGYNWNPTDLFNQKNVLDPGYEKTGVNAFQIEIPLGNKSLLKGILAIQNTWGSSLKAIKARTPVRNFEVSGCFIEKKQSRAAYQASGIEKTTEHRRMLGGDITGAICGAGVWAEAAYNHMAVSHNFSQVVLGMDYTLTNGLYLQGEYYRNGLGKTRPQAYNFNDWMDFLGENGTSPGRNYLSLGEQYPLSSLWNWSNYLISNLSDLSGMIFSRMEHSLSDNAELILTLYIPFGRRSTEYGVLSNSGFLRVKFYF